MEDKRKRCCHLPNLLCHPCVPVMKERRVENLHFNHGHFKHTNTSTFCPSLPGSPGDPCGSGAGVGPGGPGGPLGPGSPRSPFKPCLGWPWEMTQRLQCCCLEPLIKMVMKMDVVVQDVTRTHHSGSFPRLLCPLCSCRAWNVINCYGFLPKAVQNVKLSAIFLNLNPAASSTRHWWSNVWPYLKAILRRKLSKVRVVR